MKKRSLSVSNGNNNAMQIEAGGGGGETDDYNFGLFRLPENCTVVKVEVGNQKDLSGVESDDRIMLSSFIQTAAQVIPQKHTKCNVILKSNTQSMNGVSLIEYVVLMQFAPETVFDIGAYSLLQHVNPVRCGGKDSITNYFDKKFDKQCLCMTISSCRNPICFQDSVLIHQHYTTTLYTTDKDESSSTNNCDEVSINRKRARKSDIKYDKISDTSSS